MKRQTNRFQRGSGVFECSSCSRKTRDTGGDNTDVGMCEECYEIAGIENQIADRGETPELLAEIKRLTALCISKGGKLTKTLAEVVAEAKAIQSRQVVGADIDGLFDAGEFSAGTFRRMGVDVSTLPGARS